MARRLALAAVAVLCLAPPAWRRLAPRPEPPRSCEPEGRGEPPRHWIGCRADPGPPRALSGRELVLLGRPVDLNAASAEDLAAVPGLSPRLAEAVADDRRRRGRFGTVEALLRVRGVGPARLAQARPWLRVEPEP
jgi:competence protein ComEA